MTFNDGAGDDEYLIALEHHLPRVLDAHRPDLCSTWLAPIRTKETGWGG